MAQSFFKEYVRDYPEFISYEVTSAGLMAHEGQRSSPLAEEVMRKRGLSLAHHRARLLTQEIVDRAAAIICATADQENFLKNSFVNLPEICTSFFKFGGDVSDPYGEGLEVYGKIADEIEKKLPAVIKFLREEFDDH
jgi:protein-tyrosine-phosphatase